VKGSTTRAFQFAAGLLLVVRVGAGDGASAATVSVSAPPALEWAANRVRNVDPRSLEEALTRAGLEYPHMVHVTLVPEGDPRASSWPRWVVGVAEPPSDILIFPGRTARYPYDSLESVVRHEVAHLALTERARGRPLPRWFAEPLQVRSCSSSRAASTRGRRRASGAAPRSGRESSRFLEPTGAIRSNDYTRAVKPAAAAWRARGALRRDGCGRSFPPRTARPR